MRVVMNMITAVLLFTALTFGLEYLANTDLFYADLAIWKSLLVEMICSYLPVIAIINGSLLAMYPVVWYRYALHKHKLKRWVLRTLKDINAKQRVHFAQKQTQSNGHRRQTSLDRNNNNLALELQQQQPKPPPPAEVNEYEFLDEFYDCAMSECSELKSYLQNYLWLAYGLVQVFVLVYTPYYIVQHQLSELYAVMATVEVVRAANFLFVCWTGT